MHVAIIGNGIAGINVASALSSAGGVSIEVFAAEPHMLYSRPRLPEVLSGAQAPEEITFYRDDWYEKKHITVHPGTGVVSIDRAGKKIILADGRAVPYDCLVIASGASANRPPIPGADLPGVFTMRTLEDVAAIRANVAAYPESASVVGGGLLGLEAARALKDAGVAEVRVFEIAPRLLPRQLDEAGAALLKKRFAGMGIRVECGAETAAFCPAEGVRGRGNPVRAESICLKDGRRFRSDTTILSMGVHSNTELAKAAGLSVARGIRVDGRLRTDDPAIFAVGDCAEFDGVVWGIIPAALEQASVAAKSVLAAMGLIPENAAPAYVQTVPKTALKVGDIEMMSLGKAVLSDGESVSGKYTVMMRIDEGAGRYEKYVLEPAAPASGGFILAGAILYGSKAHQARVQKLSGSAVSREEIEALLSDF